MHRWFRGGRLAALVALSLLLALVAVIAWKRLRGPDAAQAQALALLQPAPIDPSLSNAWPWWWLLDYDVPETDVDRVYAADHARLKKIFARHERLRPNGYVSVAKGRYPALPRLSYRERQVLCFAQEQNCVDKARLHATQWRAALQRHAKRLARIKRLADFDVVRDTLPRSMRTPLPPFMDIQRLWLGEATLAFVDGRSDAAFTEVCTNAATWRRLRRHASNWSMQMVTEGAVREASIVLGQMLAQTPDDTTLPSVCADAFAPVTLADIDRCPAAQAGFVRYADDLGFELRGHRHAFVKHLASLLLDRRSTLAAAAPTVAFVCTAPVRQRLLADGPFGHTPQSPRPALAWTDWLANPVGAGLLRIGVIDYARNLDHAEDYAASLRLMRLRLWLRSATAHALPRSQRLQAGLKAIGGLQRREVSIDADGSHLRMTLYQPMQYGRERVFALNAVPAIPSPTSP